MSCPAEDGDSRVGARLVGCSSQSGEGFAARRETRMSDQRDRAGPRSLGAAALLDRRSVVGGATRRRASCAPRLARLERQDLAPSRDRLAGPLRPLHDRTLVLRRARRQPDPVAALKTRVRVDCGQHARPRRGDHRRRWRRSTTRIRAGRRSCITTICAWLSPAQTPLPSYSTLRRYMKAQGWFKQGRVRRHPTARDARRQRASAAREVRSFELDHVNALWHLDFHHGSRKVLTRQGTWVTPMALAVLDDRSRLACHVQWYLR